MKALLTAALLALTGTAAHAEAAPPQIEMYTPTVCLACIDYAEHLRQHGFKVTVNRLPMDDLDATKQRLNVPAGYRAIPSATVAGYFIEGHVPAEDIQRLLKDKPDARGLAVPGLPLGAPGREYSSPTCETGCTTLDKTKGTERPRREPFNTFLILKDGDSKVWWRH
ncbi:DUF411 domain-containing protein [Denitromonas iodatirespirans]|uniref:Metal-binding protein n=1 Tax=Denitromonas iodatirespirans TaxID=2795389 RepID=A0A944H9S2_DENI1|nr:DUF411 domain-containing protein [Denitromonas iodatirespirans]MBT0963743.1 metal-binding protein [Denitromonas iodatirespirans]